MSKKILNTGSKAFGPYSTAVWAGDLLFVSGQIPYNSQTDLLVIDSIQAQTHQVMKNIEAVLAHAQLTWNNVIKATIFITNMDDFADVNEVYATYFDSSLAPARETVEVSALPRGVSIEISVIASR